MNLPAHIRPASEKDVERILDLLRNAKLPTDGVKEHLDGFLVAEIDSIVAGAVGMEYFADTGLLRSLVVAPKYRGKGLGDLLCHSLLLQAGFAGVRRVVLLTTTAAQFFAARGFLKVERSSITGPVAQSVEFVSACPSSATVMTKILDD